MDPPRLRRTGLGSAVGGSEMEIRIKEAQLEPSSSAPPVHMFKANQMRL
jgi:hypothetical protein